MGVCLNGITGYKEQEEVWASILVGFSPKEEIYHDHLDDSLGPVPIPVTSGTPTPGFSSDFSGNTSITWQFQAHKEITTQLATPLTPQGLIIHVGANTDQRLVLPLPVDMRCDALGLDNGKPPVTTRGEANDSIALLDLAAAKVSTERAKIGAYQNRLEHIMDNLGVYGVNISSAESRLRDLDVSKQVMKYAKEKIILEASQAMIAQANNFPQNVLYLLK
jgi:flagellin